MGAGGDGSSGVDPELDIIFTDKKKKPPVITSMATRAEDVFENSVKRFPTRPCIITGDGSFTYTQVWTMALTISFELIRRGIKGCVAIMLPKASTLYYPSVIGVMKAGCCYISVDKAQPNDRVAYALEDAGIEFMITDVNTTKERLDNIQPPGRRLTTMTVTLTTDADIFCEYEAGGVLEELEVDGYVPDLPDLPAVASNATSSLACAAGLCQGKSGEEAETSEPEDLSDLAYIIYTSGSTGKPKGVMITQENLVTLIQVGHSGQPYNDLTEYDRVLQQASYAFDLHVEELWWPWFRGAAVVPNTKEEESDPEMMLKMLLDKQITAVSLSPPLLSMLPPGSSDKLPAIRIILVGSEAVPAVIMNTWAPNRKLFNSYGPTECTVACICGRLLSGMPSVPLGEAMPGFDIYILREDRTPVNVDEPGEGYVGGPMVGRGYLNLPEKTAAAFVNVNGERLYRTGDLLNVDANGIMFYNGRIDNQVKLRGFRIELEEIEAAIMCFCPGLVAVQNCKETKKAFLVAYCADLDAGLIEKIHTSLTTKLPHYMWPSYYVSMKEMELTTSGKLNRKNLPHYQEPRTDVICCFNKMGVVQARGAAIDDEGAEVVEEEKADSEKSEDITTPQITGMTAAEIAKLDLDQKGPEEAAMPVEIIYDMNGVAQNLPKGTSPEELICLAVLKEVLEDKTLTMEDSLANAGVSSTNMGRIAGRLREELKMPNIPTSMLITSVTVKDVALKVQALAKSAAADSLGSCPTLFASLPKNFETIDPSMRHGRWSCMFSSKWLYAKKPCLVKCLQWWTVFAGAVQTITLVALGMLFQLWLLDFWLGTDNVATWDLAKMKEAASFMQLSIVFTLIIISGMALGMPILFFLGVLEALCMQKMFIGPIEAEDIPLHSMAFYRWWLNRLMCAVAGMGGPGTPMFPFVMNLFGARMAPDCIIWGEIEPGAAELIEIGKGCCFSADTNIQNTYIEGDCLKVRPVVIGDNCYFGEGTYISAGSVIGSGTIMHPRTTTARDCVSPPDSVWHGSPAVQMDEEEIGKSVLVRTVRMLQKKAETDQNEDWATGCLIIKYWIFEFFIDFIPMVIQVGPDVLMLNAVMPYIFDVLEEDGISMLLTWLIILAWPMVVGGIMGSIVLSAIEQRCVMAMFHIPKDEIIPLGSLSHMICLHNRKVNKQFFENKLTRGVAETLFTRPILVYLFGYDIGENTEVDETNVFQFNAMKIGKNCQMNGNGVIGYPIVAAGFLSLETCVMEDTSFYGNDSILPSGCHVHSGSVIGMSTAPDPFTNIVPPDAVIFGAPAVVLPKAPAAETNDDLTFSPPASAWWLRLSSEVIKCTIMPTLRTICPLLTFMFGFWVLFQLGMIPEILWTGATKAQIIAASNNGFGPVKSVGISPVLLPPKQGQGPPGLASSVKSPSEILLEFDPQYRASDPGATRKLLSSKPKISEQKIENDWSAFLNKATTKKPSPDATVTPVDIAKKPTPAATATATATVNADAAASAIASADTPSISKTTKGIWNQFKTEAAADAAAPTMPTPSAVVPEAPVAAPVVAPVPVAPAAAAAAPTTAPPTSAPAAEEPFAQSAFGTAIACFILAAINFVLAPLLELFLAVCGKWMVIGRYKQQNVGLYDFMVSRIAIAYCFEWAADDLRDNWGLLGTPAEAWFARLFGTKVGKDCVLLGLYVHDADLCEVGDEVIAMDTTLATHTFEDRLMKMGPCNIGNKVILGQGSIVHKFVTVEDGATLGPKSFVTQNEVVSKDSIFIGFIAFPIQPKAAPKTPCPAVEYFERRDVVIDEVMTDEQSALLHNRGGKKAKSLPTFVD
jgi:non-ribosomal peptide synthetase-like protein